MSFSNDDDKDGLAALFGGITPQRATPEADARAAEPAPGQPTGEQPAPAASAPEQAAPRYPGLEPADSTPATSPPAFPTPTYQPPAYQPPPVQPTAAPPAFEPPAAQPPTFPQPAPPPSYQPPAQPPSYQPPAAQPPAYQAPAAPPPSPEPSAAQPAAPPPDQPPTYAPPAPEPPVAPPPASVGYDLPAPASPPANPTAFAPPSQPPAFAPPTAGGYDLPAPPDSGSTGAPPTAQYPTGMPFPAPVVPPPYFPTATDAVESPAASRGEAVPEPLREPPPPGGFEALGLAARDEPRGNTASEPSPYARPSEPSIAAPDHTEPPRDSSGPAGAVTDEQSARPVSAGGAVGSDGAAERPVVRVPSGALLPAAPDAAPPETPEDLARPTTLEKVGLVAAILTGPIGLVLAFVTAAIGVRRRGWVIGLTRASIVLGILSTIAVAIGGVALWNVRVAQLEHAEVAAASAQFCAAAAETPAIVEPPLLGWPDPAATIPESLTAMQEWTTRWTELIPVSPEALRPGLENLAAKGQEIVTAVETSRLVDDEANSQLIRSAAAQSNVANWHATYCVAP